MTVTACNIATVELPGVPTILVKRVLRFEGWVRRFNVEHYRSMSDVGLVSYLIDQSYTRQHAQQVVDAMGQLLFGPEDT